MVQLLREMGDFIGAEAQDLAFMPNATSAINTVMSNIPLGKGDEVLMLDIGYGSTKIIAGTACEKAGAVLIQAPVPLPVVYALALSTVCKLQNC